MLRPRTRWLGLLALVLLVGALVPASADLLSYIARPEPEATWTLQSQTPTALGTVYQMQLVSQVWQGITWRHKLALVVPNKVDFPTQAVLLITGGNNSESGLAPSMSDTETQIALMLANGTGVPMAVLYQVPNQPLFDNLHEDALIAYTFAKYLETGDDTWPLLFPMAKSAVKAMDALQGFSQQTWGQPFEKFIVTGASKRGWTTWLTGAADPRVKAIMPMVIDNLNMAKQMPHQIETWGKYSEMIDDYTQRGLQALLTEGPGQTLGAMVDPYTYRDRLTMPKLLINGTNDPYWCLDAMNLYWDDLKGPKWVLYDPNSGHGLDDQMRALAAATAFARLIAADQPPPAITWKHEDADGKLRLTVTSDPKPTQANLWVARSTTKDFRQAKWESQAMTEEGGNFVGEVEKPTEGYLALLGEPAYEMGGRSFTLSTQVRIVGAQ